MDRRLDSTSDTGNRINVQVLPPAPNARDLKSLGLLTEYLASNQVVYEGIHRMGVRLPPALTVERIYHLVTVCSTDLESVVSCAGQAGSDEPEGEPTRSVGGTPQGCPNTPEMDLSTERLVQLQEVLLQEQLQAEILKPLIA